MSTIFTHSLPNLLTTSVAIAFHHGSAHDSLAGTTNVLVNTLIRGSSTYSENQLHSLIDGRGSEFFSIIAPDYTILGIRSLPELAEENISILFDLLHNPLLSPEIVDIEKNKAIQEITSDQTDWIKSIEEYSTAKTVFGENHPLGTPKKGQIDHLTNLTRDDLLSCLENEFMTNPVGILLGNFSTGEEVQYKNFFSEQIDSLPRLSSTSPEFPEPLVSSLNMFCKPNQQHNNAYFSINQRVDPEYLHYGNMQIMSSIIGYPSYSRLFTVLREQNGLSYFVWCRPFVVGASGYLSSMFDVDALKVEQGLSHVVSTLKSFEKQPLSEEEFLIHKQNTLSTLDNNFDFPQTITKILIDGYYHYNFQSLEEFYESIRETTMETVIEWYQSSLLEPSQFSLTAEGKVEEKTLREVWEAQF